MSYRTRSDCARTTARSSSWQIKLRTVLAWLAGRASPLVGITHPQTSPMPVRLAFWKVNILAHRLELLR